MELSQTSVGPFNLYSIEAGRFALDGGAMFGVVPKTLWSRYIDVDDHNRIPMAMRCLLVESENTGNVYLIDTGSGTKFDDKFKDIYQLDYKHSDLLRSLNRHGFDPEDVTDVIFSHLHFDHCGGTTYYDEAGNLQHTFPNARYHVTEQQLETANNPNVREKASFLADNIDPITNWDKLHLVDDHHSYEDGFEALPVNGHTLGQQLPKISAEDTTVVFMADLIPTHVHLPLPWVMGYDMYPVTTLEEKEEFLEQAVEKDWFLFMEHDADQEIITATKDNGKYTVAEKLTLQDIET
jgi:glyoxylase-like metal-dependent hydrolase (beta-lactamase superfamily II)